MYLIFKELIFACSFACFMLQIFSSIPVTFAFFLARDSEIKPPPQPISRTFFFDIDLSKLFNINSSLKGLILCSIL